VIEVPGAIAVCFDAPTVELFEQRTEALHPRLRALGPDLLVDPFDLDEALRRLRDANERPPTIGEALLDQRALAGIGNEVRNQALWEARVSPFRPVEDVDDATLREVVERSRRILKEGARTGRRPSDVYGNAGRPCPRCGTLIRSVTYGGGLPRIAYWCPACQPDPSKEL
jgi:endonuclease VIII